MLWVYVDSSLWGRESQVSGLFLHFSPDLCFLCGRGSFLGRSLGLLHGYLPRCSWLMCGSFSWVRVQWHFLALLASPWLLQKPLCSNFLFPGCVWAGQKWPLWQGHFVPCHSGLRLDMLTFNCYNLFPSMALPYHTGFFSSPHGRWECWFSLTCYDVTFNTSTATLS